MPIAQLNNAFQYVQERDAPFLALFPHRFDYIWAEHPASNASAEWKSENRHPLSDRLIDQGAYLYGVRFGKSTNYSLIDIDRQSQYHPARDPQAIKRLIDALEPLGLVAAVICTSSYSGGLHLYFPFEQPQKTWQVAIALQTLLENEGFQIALGQLELFPNAKAYVKDQPSLYAAHRLPLQVGSYLLNDDLQPIYSTRDTFVERWQFAQQRNAINAEQIDWVIKAARRQQYRLSGKADKYLNDLNAEIEIGWTDFGQTNYLLGRIAMRSYVFGHVLYAAQPLEGKALVTDIIRVATSLPGYEQWCRHQNEIEKRAEEWAQSVEASHYFHYKHRRKLHKANSDIAEPTWNQQQQKEARDRIKAAIADLLENEALPPTATARFQKLTAYGIGGSSLYRHRDLWHPVHLQPVENSVETPPNPPASLDCSGWESSGAASQPLYSPSLLESVGGNPALEGHFSSIESAQNEDPGRNFLDSFQDDDSSVHRDCPNIKGQPSPNTPQWIQLLLFQVKNLKRVPQITPDLDSNMTTGGRAIAHQQQYLERMQKYLESGDSILIGEALQVLKPTG